MTNRPDRDGMPPLSGALLVDKPAGLSTMAITTRVRHLARDAWIAHKHTKFGHLGTLDPFATGLVVILIGEATKLVDRLHDATKTYRATIRFGTATDTLDRDGSITRTAPAPRPPRATLDAAVASLVGTRLQSPPAFSAVKVSGVRAYELARKGEPVATTAKSITVFDATYAPDDAPDDASETDHAAANSADPLAHWPDLALRLTVSSGTYIRVLAEECAAALDLPAHLTALRRERAGGFTLTDATPLASLTLENLAAHIHPMPWLIEHANLPTLAVPHTAAARFANGLIPHGVTLPDPTPHKSYIIVDETTGEPAALLEPRSPERGEGWQVARGFVLP